MDAGVNVGKPVDFVDSCYLIKHGTDWMVWDTGLTDAIFPRHHPIRMHGSGPSCLWASSAIDLPADLDSIRRKRHEEFSARDRDQLRLGGGLTR